MGSGADPGREHVEHILDKFGIEPSPGEHRRVLAVLMLLRAGHDQT